MNVRGYSYHQVFHSCFLSIISFNLMEEEVQTIVLEDKLLLVIDTYANYVKMYVISQDVGIYLIVNINLPITNLIHYLKIIILSLQTHNNKIDPYQNQPRHNSINQSIRTSNIYSSSLNFNN